MYENRWICMTYWWKWIKMYRKYMNFIISVWNIAGNEWKCIENVWMCMNMYEHIDDNQWKCIENAWTFMSMYGILMNTNETI